MESDSPEIAPLLYAYCYACIDLRRAAETALRPNATVADAQRLHDAKEFFGAAKRAYFEADDSLRAALSLSERSVPDGLEPEDIG